MAFQIDDQPSADIFYPSYSPIEYLVNSDNTAQPNFKLYCYIHRDPSGDNELVGVKRVPFTPGSTKVLIDIADYVKDYLSTEKDTVSTTASSLTDETDVYGEFKVAFREYWGTPPALTGSAISGNVLTAYNAAPRFVERYDPTIATTTSYPNWKIVHEKTGTASVQNPFLTSFENVWTAQSGLRPSGLNHSAPFLPIRQDQKLNLSLRFDGDAGTCDFAAIFYDEDFVETTYEPIQQSPSTSGLGLFSLNIGLPQIVNNSQVVIGPVSTDKYMSITMIGNSGVGRSCILLYELIWEDCDKYTNYHIHWVNRFGGWDSYVFTGRSYLTEENDRVSYLRDSRTFTSTTIDETPSKEMMGTHYIGTKENYVLNSEIVDAWMVSGFRDLFSSPKVFWDHPIYGFVQITPQGKEYPVKNAVGDKAFNIQFSFTLDHNNRRQIR